MTVFIAFGLAGAGKTHFANWAANHFNIHCEDADSWLTPAMRLYIRDGKLFTPDMLNDYFNRVIQKIAELKRIYPDIIVAQAFYREINRQQLLAAYPDAIFIHVYADERVILQRLLSRDNEVTLDYARKNASYFEQPQHACIRMDNSRDHDDGFLLKQCLSVPAFAKLSANNNLLFRQEPVSPDSTMKKGFLI